MKRQDLIRHVESHGCRLLREGGKHSVYYNPENNQTSVMVEPGTRDRYISVGTRGP